MDLDPSPSAGVQLLFCQSVSNCKNLQYTKNFLSFMERIPYNHSNTNLEKSRVKLIYPNYRAVHLFNRTKISHRQIQIDPLFLYIHFFHPQIQISARFGKNGLGPQPATYLFMTACVFGHSIRQ